jgi:transposase
LSLQALEEFQLNKFFEQLGWSQEQIQLTMTQIISRAAYPASELKTSHWIKENSAVCEVTQYPVDKLTKDKLYQNALALYQVKDALEQHLSARTNELFDLENKIMLYDLTNTYFEGRKVNSKLAQFGRSKEKRSDAKIIVLALVVNPEGFLKYSNVFEGNTTDSKKLKQSSQISYFISSAKFSTSKFNQAIRGLWAIENNLLWSLDVLFQEDG